ncbi:vacuolar assembly protein, putative [Talaromyces stipitatus ATCC 10500]|uniref:Vacuolar assembly protein, putative n=1 Tax=Talaromyces stipitatus (strain ATCC 10500 / CBS 375.48 / QM 6759 / NRRL 1006) TaxID=441959 RepID=B8M5N2_TALSN|nr:vacuolar assembly protein, putative [Talaromyces stipitatus ATCC 10500]EED19926.1 vacuolar assembly protein, putative [Talaromyces stipitatus ATCC 10500]
MDLPGAAEGSNDADTLKIQSPSAESSSRLAADDSSRDQPEDDRDSREQDESADDNEGNEGDEENEEEEEEEEEDEEPRLKYVYLTKCLPSLYRGGDATSTLLVGGDKMIVGTHNGNIHVVSLPTLKALRVYTAHSASVTSVSISPLLLSHTITRHNLINRSFEEDDVPSPNASLRSKGKPAHAAGLPPTALNSIHIATSSIDGNVCVYSLLDPKDVLLRNFGRPVQAVALSPEYKSDRQYLSGGRAGQLILTVGGRPGTTEKSTTLNGAASAAGWLGSLGLGANSGKDTVLHSGEGAINTIKWSLSGKYVAWVNEEGIKIMRSNLHLEAADAEFAWTRIRHIDRPNRPQWEEMASVWKAHAEWVDMKAFEISENSDAESISRQQSASGVSEVEKLVVGWGGTIWVINVYPDRTSPPGTRAGNRKLGDAEVVTILRTDSIISGVAMYSPRLLLVLAYLESDNSDLEEQPQSSRRHKAAEPELRLIDLETQEEVSADTLSITRYQNLASSDYHMSILRPPRLTAATVQRGALGTLGTGLLDATLYPARLFASSASVRSNGSNGDRGSERVAGSFISGSISGVSTIPKEIQTLSAAKGLKVFVHSPYDCIAAMSRDLTDRLAWLESHQKYEEAWALIDQNPGVLNPPAEQQTEAFVRSQTSLADFFADDSSSVVTAGQPLSATVRNEKSRIGELWIEQHIQNNGWVTAGEICAKVLDVPDRWEHWIWKFVEAGKYDEVAQYIPINTRPPLSSAIFDAFLEHYVSHNRQTFEHLLSQWPPELFDITKAISTIEDCLESERIPADSNDWRILMGSLGKLFLANGQHREALRCYIRLQDAEEALRLISEYRLADAISDDVLNFILLRVSKYQWAKAPISELEQVTAESISILVREAYNGIVRPGTVVSQLYTSSGRLYLFFYLRALWKGESHPSKAEAKPQLRGRGRHARDAAEKLAADEGKSLVEPFADITLDLFADYDRQLLMDFLQASTAYSFGEACRICEEKHYTSELIYLLSKTGQTKRALNLILSDLNDVSQAINFAKSQDDPDLWEDLLSYSMDKPAFIHALLTEAGTSIDPIKLVRRIPSGLEIEGLRDGLTRLLRDHDIQASISQGAAKVLQGEVAIGMDALRRGQRRGIKFDVHKQSNDENEPEMTADTEDSGEVAHESENDEGLSSTTGQSSRFHRVAPGQCGGCLQAFHENEKEILVGFACGHVFHLSHVQEPAHTHDNESTNINETTPTPPAEDDIEDSQLYTTSRTVGPKVITARLIRDKIGDGCRICALNRQVANAAAPENT